MTDIFLSYAREDQDRAQKLAAALENTGWTVFWDRTIPPGLTWRKYIGKALRGARCVIVGWSEDSVQSEWVVEEADVGKDRGTLIPVFFDPVSPPLGFRSIQAMDLSSWNGEPEAPELRRLVTGMERLLGPAPAAPGTGRPGEREASERPDVAKPHPSEPPPTEPQPSDPPEASEPPGPSGGDTRPPAGGLSFKRPALFAMLALLVLLSGIFLVRSCKARPDGTDGRPGTGADRVGEKLPDPQGADRTPAQPSKELPAKLTVRSNVANDMVYVNGVAHGATPLRLELEAGNHHLEIRHAKCENTEEKVELRSGEERTIEIRLPCGPPGFNAARDLLLNPRVPIKGGEFVMGSRKGVGRANQRPQHRVGVSTFWIQKYEVSNEQFQLFKPEHQPEENHGPKHPVVNVTWSEAKAYAEWSGGRLPTEAEWEYAARGVKGREYPWGAQAPDCSRAGFIECIKGILPVGHYSRGATPEGVEDLAGNAWEWCSDWYVSEYPATAQKNPAGPSRGEKGMRVVRGGSFFDEAEQMRATYRDGVLPGERNVGQGFRVVFQNGTGQN